MQKREMPVRIAASTNSKEYHSARFGRIQDQNFKFFSCIVYGAPG